MRWPRPQVCRPSMARMLVAIGWRMLARSSGATPRPSMRRDSLSGSGPLPSIGWPKPLSTRPSSCVEHQMRGAAETFSIRSPRATPARAGQRHQQRRVLPEADDLGRRRACRRSCGCGTGCPSGSGRSDASIVSPLMRLHLARRRETASTLSTASSWAARQAIDVTSRGHALFSGRSAWSCGDRASKLRADPAAGRRSTRSSCVQVRVDLAAAGEDAAAAGRERRRRRSARRA